MLFSVLIANYNNAKYIKEAVESIERQAYHNWEIVIVDDASTDNSLEVINQFAQNNLKVKLYKHDINEGVGKTNCQCHRGYHC